MIYTNWGFASLYEFMWFLNLNLYKKNKNNIIKNANLNLNKVVKGTSLCKWGNYKWLSGCFSCLNGFERVEFKWISYIRDGDCAIDYCGSLAT